MNHTILKLTGGFCIAAGLSISATTSQASILYPGSFGPTANGTVFSGVTEDTATEAANTVMYGAPTAILPSNKIVFTPTAQFTATSSDGHSNDPDDSASAFALSEGQLTQVLITNAGGLGNIVVGETGHYNLKSFGGIANISAAATATLTYMNGPLAGQTITQVLDLNGATAGNDLDITQAGAGTIPDTNWTGQTVFAAGSATSVILTLDNDLASFSQAGTLGVVSKNRVDISVGAAVPEPATAGLLALGAIAFARRRRD